MAKNFLTVSDVASFLSEKNASPVCPFCGEQMKILAADEEGSTFVATMGIAESIKDTSPNGPMLKSSGRRIPVVMCQCDNCSFLANFAADDIRKWCLAKATNGKQEARDA